MLKSAGIRIFLAIRGTIISLLYLLTITHEQFTTLESFTYNLHLHDVNYINNRNY